MSKQILAPVGIGGRNLVNDVMTVQFLLNCVPDTAGGPREELVIDGLAGPLTNGAIQRFQRTNFGWSDGRVDPENTGGVTIVKLNEFDPTPGGPPILPHTFPTFPGGFGKRRPGKGQGKKAGGTFPSIFFPGKKAGGKV